MKSGWTYKIKMFVSYFKSYISLSMQFFKSPVRGNFQTLKFETFKFCRWNWHTKKNYSGSYLNLSRLMLICLRSCNPFLSILNLSNPKTSMTNLSNFKTSKHLKCRITYNIESLKDQILILSTTVLELHLNPRL